jgi:hypothetical protein
MRKGKGRKKKNEGRERLTNKQASRRRGERVKSI